MNREPMDIGEVAKNYADMNNQAAVAAVLVEARRPVGPSAEICEWCEEEIPEDRRLAQPGCTMCVGCQAAKERLKERQ